KILLKHQGKSYPGKRFVYKERRLIGKFPLIPEEVGLLLRAMGFDNTTRIYLAPSKLFAGDRLMITKPFEAMFPHLENHSTVGPGTGMLEENTQGLAWSAVDYMVCLLSDIFIPTYDGPSNFAHNLMGHRLYHGFQTTIAPDRKALARIFIDREEGRASGYEERVRQLMFNAHFGGPRKRIHPESFYTNSWPECFCQTEARSNADQCPPDDMDGVIESQFQSEEDIEVKFINKTDSTSQTEWLVI
ncbi:Os06g0502800, partial [Oryza sativa Japonica Group]